MSKKTPIEVTRRARLKELISDKAGGKAAGFGRLIQRSESLVCQYASGHREMGEKLARHIEESLRLPAGWMDVPVGEPGWRLTADTRRVVPREARERIEMLARMADAGEISWDLFYAAMDAALAVAASSSAGGGRRSP